ncbi:hypothetical protein B9Z19DRAFT_1124626 [Tuber borchii]|uniref:Uncharacterized protein n=1 Tax=Tuber borchii TaxID=42251 RepID=A0A2T6ZWI3_TUBBO|nr:hypothetical protein B9Z19DRAFT_1124626 [Tuber borchii]
MPTRLHEAGASWLAKQYARWRANGLIDDVGEDFLGLQPSPRIGNFMGAYNGSLKEPDYSIIPDGINGLPRSFPSVVLESGWTSSETKLDCHRHRWHEGSDGNVRVVLLPKIFKPNVDDEIRAILKVSHTIPGAGAQPTLISIKLFPPSNPPAADPTLTMNEL